MPAYSIPASTQGPRFIVLARNVTRQFTLRSQRTDTGTTPMIGLHTLVLNHWTLEHDSSEILDYTHYVSHRGWGSTVARIRCRALAQRSTIPRGRNLGLVNMSIRAHGSLAHPRRLDIKHLVALIRELVAAG